MTKQQQPKVKDNPPPPKETPGTKSWPSGKNDKKNKQKDKAKKSR